MQQLTVPEDVWACRQPGVPFVAAIVDGEIVASSAPMFPDSNLPGTSSIPPAWLVALRDARCETCVDEYGERVMQNCNNPRCHNGWLLHDVRVETYCPQQCDVWPCKWPERDCSAGAYHRTVRCLVDFVEVRAFPMLIGSHVVISGDEVWFWPNTDVRPLAVDTPSGLQFTDPDVLTPAQVDALTAACGKPPAEWPGGYAVILTEVGE